MSNTSKTGGGISFCSALALVFITLKLLKIIDWSWWWVLAPLWGPVALALLIAIGIASCKTCYKG